VIPLKGQMQAREAPSLERRSEPHGDAFFANDRTWRRYLKLR